MIMLTMHCHGGKCCGISHIQGFQGNPKYSSYEQVTVLRKDANVADSERCMNPGTNLYYGPLPSETNEKRFLRYLKFIKKLQPKGLVEVTLVSYQKKDWDEILTREGFKIVTEFLNSNSGNTVSVYHLVYPEKKKS